MSKPIFKMRYKNLSISEFPQNGGYPNVVFQKGYKPKNQEGYSNAEIRHYPSDMVALFKMAERFIREHPEINMDDFDEDSLIISDERPKKAE